MIMLIAFLFGALAIGMPLAWVIGLFNPIGYMGVPPWRLPAEAKRDIRK